MEIDEDDSEFEGGSEEDQLVRDLNRRIIMMGSWCVMKRSTKRTDHASTRKPSDTRTRGRNASYN